MKTNLDTRLMSRL